MPLTKILINQTGITQNNLLCMGRGEILSKQASRLIKKEHLTIFLQNLWCFNINITHP